MGFYGKAIQGGAVALSALRAEERVKVLQHRGLYPNVKALLNLARELRKSRKSSQTIPDIISSSQQFPTINKQKLYIREYYKTFYDHITELFISEVRGNHRLCIVGTSGIGKSSIFLYFILRLLSESKDSPIVIFHTREGDWFEARPLYVSVLLRSSDPSFSYLRSGTWQTAPRPRQSTLLKQ